MLNHPPFGVTLAEVFFSFTVPKEEWMKLLHLP